jgi:membrane glycosyltransferase
MMMLIQSRSVTEILTGKDSGWSTQRRDDGTIPFAATVRRHLGQTILGILAGTSAFVLASTLAGWMAPTLIGLVLAIPLSHVSGLASVGLALRRWGLLLTPEETNRPRIALAAETAARGFSAEAQAPHPLLALTRNPALMQQHLRALPTTIRKRGDVSPERAMAETKLSDAATRQEAAGWLRPSEALIVMADRALLQAFSALPDA